MGRGLEGERGSVEGERMKIRKRENKGKEE